MNWEAIAAISEGIGAIAVVITLAYLALQIRQNTAAMRSTATQGAHDQAAEFYRTLAEDPELPLIIARGCQSPDDLSKAEIGRYFAVLQLSLFNFQNWYFQTRDHFMDDTLLSSWSRIVTSFSGTPGFRRFWEARGYIFAPEFRDFLETRIFSEERDVGFKPLGIDLEG